MANTCIWQIRFAGIFEFLPLVFVEQWQKNAILAIAKKGHKVKKHSPLSLRGDELFLGRLNDQVIRTASERPITRLPQPRQPPGIP